MEEEKKININDAEEQLNNGNETANNADNDQNADNEAENATSEDNAADTNAENAEKPDNADKKEEEKDPLTKAKEELESLKDKYLRQIAEFDNYRKRTMKEKSELILNGGEKTLKAILPILDDFERALDDKNNNEPQAMREGFELIYKKFVSTLEGQGVKAIDTTDKDFDTDLMEAIALVPGMGDDKKGKVIDCVSKGYTLNEKVLRHAKVAVGQ